MELIEVTFFRCSYFTYIIIFNICLFSSYSSIPVWSGVPSVTQAKSWSKCSFKNKINGTILRSSESKECVEHIFNGKTTFFLLTWGSANIFSVSKLWLLSTCWWLQVMFYYWLISSSRLQSVVLWQTKSCSSHQQLHINWGSCVKALTFQQSEAALWHACTPAHRHTHTDLTVPLFSQVT